MSQRTSKTSTQQEKEKTATPIEGKDIEDKA